MSKATKKSRSGLAPLVILRIINSTISLPEWQIETSIKTAKGDADEAVFYRGDDLELTYEYRISKVGKAKLCLNAEIDIMTIEPSSLTGCGISVLKNGIVVATLKAPDLLPIGLPKEGLTRSFVGCIELDEFNKDDRLEVSTEGISMTTPIKPIVAPLEVGPIESSDTITILDPLLEDLEDDNGAIFPMVVTESDLDLDRSYIFELPVTFSYHPEKPLSVIENLAQMTTSTGDRIIGSHRTIFRPRYLAPQPEITLVTPGKIDWRVTKKAIVGDRSVDYQLTLIREQQPSTVKLSLKSDQSIGYPKQFQYRLLDREGVVLEQGGGEFVGEGWEKSVSVAVVGALQLEIEYQPSKFDLFAGTTTKIEAEPIKVSTLKLIPQPSNSPTISLSASWNNRPELSSLSTPNRDLVDALMGKLLTSDNYPEYFQHPTPIDYKLDLPKGQGMIKLEHLIRLRIDDLKAHIEEQQWTISDELDLGIAEVPMKIDTSPAIFPLVVPETVPEQSPEKSREQSPQQEAKQLKASFSALTAYRQHRARTIQIFHTPMDNPKKSTKK